ncbi:MAG: trypsin-like serine protease [Verrucomicrobia bacterium]|nr:trypsin-like serine protease [Verrucomicrobiota bacterium]
MKYFLSNQLRRRRAAKSHAWRWGLIGMILILLVPLQWVWGLAKGPVAKGNPEEDKDDLYVGRVQLEVHDETSQHCTGSLIDKGVVLTAAHCINPTNEPDRQFAAHFERFTLYERTKDDKRVNRQYFALGVQHPAYNPFVDFGGNDIGLLLVLNGPVEPLGALAAEADKVKNGDTVTLIGFTSASGNYPLSGLSVLHATKGTTEPKELVYDRSKAGAVFEPGDSGGPTLFTFDKTRKIIGVHSFSEPDPNKEREFITDVDTRVNQYLEFLQGKGGPSRVDGVRQAVLCRWKGADSGDWNKETRWERASADPPDAVPQTDDVAILDPSRNEGDLDTKVDISAPGTAALEGLLTDVKLNIANNGSLVVKGISGTLNGGEINIGDGSAGSAQFRCGLDNVGTINIKAKGTLTLGNTSLFPDTATDTVLLNGKSVLVDGGKLEVKKALENRGTLQIKGAGTANAGANLPGKALDGRATVSILNSDKGSIVVDEGNLTMFVGFLNSGRLAVGTKGVVSIGQNLPIPPKAKSVLVVNCLAGSSITVGAGGTLTISAREKFSAFVNLDAKATLSVEGGDGGGATVTTDTLQSEGAVVVKSRGTLNATKRFGIVPKGSLTVSSDAKGAGTVKTESFYNAGTVTINEGCLLEAKGADGYRQDDDGVTCLNDGRIDCVDNDGKKLKFEVKRGKLLGKGTLSGVVVNNGKIKPNKADGLLIIEGDLNLLSGGSVELALSGSARGLEYDAIDVTSGQPVPGVTYGNLLLGGQLELDILNGFEDRLTRNDSFRILSSSHLEGVFDNVTPGGRLNSVDGRGSFLVHYGGESPFAPNEVVLSDFRLNPKMAIALTEFGLVEISWLEVFENYQLEQAESLDAAWTLASPLPAIVDGKFRVTLPASTRVRFFRLESSNAAAAWPP